MTRVKIFQNFGILFLCIFCIGASVDARDSSLKVLDKGAIDNYEDDLAIYSLRKLSSILKHIPLVGPLLNAIDLTLLGFITTFERTTNSLLDRILRESLPCLISSEEVRCDGVYKNGGFGSIIRRAIDLMPDDMPLYIIKKVLDPMMIFGSLLLTGSLY
ncbi:hypothetical protein KPH14_008562 [Odynerus spinipes]|uniref:Uncharacterized protein n=1 Tax=Odynerus spinipes TaxID=1348599 RepID=A0AAD9RSC3_9HYME|nr:hypothetical protein KPH14_008562 [Odynerus spinipes]